MVDGSPFTYKHILYTSKQPASCSLDSCTQEHRRSYRENFYTAPLGASVSGVILFKEALSQAASDGTSFVQCLSRQGVLAGVKVDEVFSTAVTDCSTTPFELGCLASPACIMQFLLGRGV